MKYHILFTLSLILTFSTQTSSAEEPRSQVTPAVSVYENLEFGVKHLQGAFAVWHSDDYLDFGTPEDRISVTSNGTSISFYGTQGRKVYYEAGGAIRERQNFSCYVTKDSALWEDARAIVNSIGNGSEVKAAAQIGSGSCTYINHSKSSLQLGQN